MVCPAMLLLPEPRSGRDRLALSARMSACPCPPCDSVQAGVFEATLEGTYREPICQPRPSGAALMPENIADPPSLSCYHLFFTKGIQEYQQVDPDRLRPRARDARGRFVQGSSGNPRGRRRGIRNPPRRV